MAAKDCRENGRIILAYGEVTGHYHEVVTVETEQPPDMDAAQFFEEPDGRRVLMAMEPCVLRHDEHGAIRLVPEEAADGSARVASGVALAPAESLPGQYRQGDVLLHPIGRGIWHVIRQREGYRPDKWRQVAD